MSKDNNQIWIYGVLAFLGVFIFLKAKPTFLASASPMDDFLSAVGANWNALPQDLQAGLFAAIIGTIIITVLFAKK